MLNNLFEKIEKKFSYWTPRYIANRIMLFIGMKSNPDWPWLTKDAIEILNKLLNKDDLGLEFGAGRSTKWLAKRVSKLISIEHDKKWFDKVRQDLQKEGVKNVELYLKSEHDYLDIFKKTTDKSINFILVDGLRRDECVKLSISKIKNGGLLIIDNINWFVPSNSHSPASRHGNDFESEIWREVFIKDIKDWRKIWTSNGVTDTLIIFKP